MLKLNELESIEKHIEKTRLAGEKADETTYKVLKNFLTTQMLECIGARDARLRRYAMNVIGNFNSLSDEHKKRVIFSMSNKM